MPLFPNRRATFFDPPARQRIVSRLRSLEPGAVRRWGSMSAPQMVAHLSDQMTLTLGMAKTRPRRGLLRLPLAKQLSIYWVPWPRGRVKGPSEAFVTAPGSWSEDLERLIGLVEAFGRRSPSGDWPEHAMFGPMSGRDWGALCHKHFDHHLRQFGA